VISGGEGGIRTHGLQEAAAIRFDDIIKNNIKYEATSNSQKAVSHYLD